MRKRNPECSDGAGKYQGLISANNWTVAVNNIAPPLEDQLESVIPADVGRYPLTFLVIKIAIAAARTGHAIAVSILGLSPNLTHKLVARCQQHLGADSVDVLFNRGVPDPDTDKQLVVVLLSNRVADIAARLAFVAPNARRPALLAFSEPSLGEEVFCPWLTLYCDDDELRNVRHWLDACHDNGCQAKTNNDDARAEFDDDRRAMLSVIELIVRPLVDEVANDLFRAVLHGSARLLFERPSGATSKDTAIAAYSLSGKLLTSPTVTMADETPSKRLRTMVDRANLLLEARRANQQAEPRLKVQRSSTQLSRSGFVDLGDASLGWVDQIISHLRLLPGEDLKREKLPQLGFVDPEYVQLALLDDIDALWEDKDALREYIDALREQLVTWSYKQVRTTLGRAVEAKWLSSERQYKNAPVINKLPESSRSLGNPWLKLPAKTEIAAQLVNVIPAGQGLP